MEIPNIDDYEKIKEGARFLYMQISPIWSSDLNDWVIFNNIGFDHLIKKGRRFRSKGEQMRRFLLLRYVENIVNSKSFVSTEKRIIATSSIQYWKFIDNKNDWLITVIIRQVEDGNKHFLSIYGRIKKSTFKT